VPEAARGTGEVAGARDQDATEEVRVMLEIGCGQRWQGVDATYRVSGIRDAAWTAMITLLNYVDIFYKILLFVDSCYLIFCIIVSLDCDTLLLR